MKSLLSILALGAALSFSANASAALRAPAPTADTLAIGATAADPALMARRGRGADDGAGDDRGGRGRGADDGANHARRGRGADDGAGHQRRGRGADDGANHA